MIRTRASDPRIEDLDLLLVRAATDGPASRVSWDGLCNELARDPSMAALRGERQDLLGILWARSMNHDVPDHVSDRLKGVYRRTWYRNRLQLARLAGAVEGLRGAGIACLVVDDAALLSGYYGSFGERPLQRTGVLVRTGRYADAVHVLECDAWSSQSPSDGSLLTSAGTRLFRDRTGSELELHAHFGAGISCDTYGLSDDADAIWNRARDLELEHSSMRCPGPEHTLLRLLAERDGWWPRARLLRITDVALVLQQWNGEWNLFLREARNRHAMPQVVERVGWLHSLQLEVPDPLLAMISEERVDLLDSLAHRAQRLSPAVARQLLRSRAVGPVRAAVELPAALRDGWGLEHTRSVPLTAARKLVSSFRAGSN